MQTDAQKWEERYRSGDFPGDNEPAAFLWEVFPFLPRGRALDLAMGAGRSAVFLAANGWQVTGIDRARTALEKATALAGERGVHVHWARALPPKSSPRSTGLLLLEADLENCLLPISQFEVIVCFYYLQRSLFAAIQRALRPGGILVYETYTLEQLAFHKGPHNPEHLLRPHELRDAFESLQTLFYRELRAGKGIASLLARKP